MRKLLKSDSIIMAISILFILLFFYTALSKLLDFNSFIGSLRSVNMFSFFLYPISFGIPLIEIIVSIALYFKNTRLFGLISTVILMGMFTVYVAVILSFKDNIPCSCGGIIELLSWNEHLVVNSLLLGLAIVGYLMERRNKAAKQLAVQY